MSAAESYARRGLAVFPVFGVVKELGRLRCSCSQAWACKSPGKHPHPRFAPNGLNDATLEPSVIRGWSAAGAGEHNWAIATGAVSGIIVIDVDAHKDGFASLQHLEARHGALPHTVRHLTGGGGEHILLRHPGRRVANSVGQIAPGVDIRGDGGYIVAPPSLHISGRPYAVSVDHHPDEVDIAEAPEWLLRLIDQPQSRTPKNRRHWRGFSRSVIREGRRNDAITRFTGHLLGKKVDPHVALDLLDSWNRDHCEPPLDPEELVSIVASIAMREGRKHAAR